MLLQSWLCTIWFVWHGSNFLSESFKKYTLKIKLKCLNTLICSKQDIYKTSTSSPNSISDFSGQYVVYVHISTITSMDKLNLLDKVSSEVGIDHKITSNYIIGVSRTSVATSCSDCRAYIPSVVWNVILPIQLSSGMEDRLVWCWTSDQCY